MDSNAYQVGVASDAYQVGVDSNAYQVGVDSNVSSPCVDSNDSLQTLSSLEKLAICFLQVDRLADQHFYVRPQVDVLQQIGPSFFR